MKWHQIRWSHIKDCRKANKQSGGKSLFAAFCFLNSCCEECHPKVRRWCKIKNWIMFRIQKRQEQIITKAIDEQEEASKYITMCGDWDD